MKKVLLSVVFSLILVTGIGAQVADCPVGFVCISQAAANKAAENARELEAQKEKIKVLEDALVQERKSTEEFKVVNAKNVSDLTLLNNDLTVKLAQATGQLIEKDATITRQTAILEVLVKNTRKKCMPFSVCF